MDIKAYQSAIRFHQSHPHLVIDMTSTTFMGMETRPADGMKVAHIITSDDSLQESTSCRADAESLTEGCVGLGRELDNLAVGAGKRVSANLLRRTHYDRDTHANLPEE